MDTSEPLKPCNHSGCRTLVTSKYCGKHESDAAVKKKENQRQYDNIRGTRTARGYDNRWLKASKEFAREFPLCANCEKKGIIKLGQCTDHIVPHKGDVELFWDRSNWQRLCNVCHGEKTAAEDGGFSNPIRTV